MTVFGHARRQDSHPRLPNSAPMSHGAPSFEHSWEELRPRLERMLRQRGAEPHVVDDVVQETALRLLGAWDRIDGNEPLWPLARTIGRNCLADRYRGPVVLPLADLPDRPDPQELEERGLARARLSKVQTALQILPPNDRSILLAEVGVGPRVHNSSASKMARLRARKRLHEVMDRIATAFSGVSVTWRKVYVWLNSQSPSDLQAAATSGTGLVAALSVVFIAFGSGDSVVVSPSPHGKEVHGQKVHAARPNLEDHPRSNANGQSRRDTSMSRGSDAALQARDGSTVSDPTPASSSASSEDTVAEAGPVRAKSGEGKGHRYSAVCVGGESERGPVAEVSVIISDESHDPDDDPEPCS